MGKYPPSYGPSLFHSCFLSLIGTHSPLYYFSKMGKLHNRRRTRLRANKKAHHQAIPVPLLSTQAMPTINDNASFCYERSTLSSFNDNKQFHTNQQHEIRHTQFYGVEEGDESGDLCPLMLQVVLDLFDGVDYEDF